MNHFDLTRFLKNNVKPALGCTEIVVIGLASALAYLTSKNQLPKFLEDPSTKNPAKNQLPIDLNDLQSINIKLDRNVFKNAKAVAIPMPDELINDLETGIKFAAVLGLFCNLDQFNIDDVLTLFSKVDTKIANQAKKLSQQLKTNIEIVNNHSHSADLFVEVKLNFIQKSNSSQQMFGLAKLEHDHSHITLLSNQDGVLYQANKQFIQNKNIDPDLETLAKLDLPTIVALCQNLPEEAKTLLKANIAMNLALAKKGLEGKHGLKLGASYQQLINNGQLSNDLINKVKVASASACDARMGGAMKPAMSTAGSGNQGITASIPVIVVAQENNYQEEKLLQALSLSHLITSYVAYYSGHLSALCGCAIKAGIGATAGIAYYLSNGDCQIIEGAIHNMIANLTGIICDGAKVGCALKLATASASATESALLAIRGVVVPNNNGILNEKIEQSLQHIGEISNSMVITDQIMVEKLMGAI